MAIVMGTAGHIDHGKTSLVRKLTGIDCDRLEEEKRRGITIELGFAFCDLPGGRLSVLRTRLARSPPAAPTAPGVFVADGAIWGRCGDGACVEILDATVDGRAAGVSTVAALLAR